MKTSESLVRDALVNIQHFLDANSVALGPVNTSGARQDLDGAAAALSGHAVSQGEHTTASTGETRKERSIRVSIRRQYLRPIAQVAATRSADVPQLGTLRLPHGKLVGANFVDAANIVANNAEPYVAVLVAAGLKPDFLIGLRGKLQELEASRGGRVGHAQVRKSSTIALGVAARKGRKAIKALDGVIEQQIPDNAQLLAEWKSVKRVAKKPGPVQSAGVTSVTPPGVVPPVVIPPVAPTSNGTVA
jgi:hypothetical protein